MDMKRSQKRTFFEQIKSFRLRNVALWLIGINVFVFILQSIIGDSFTNTFMLVAGDLFARPWILLTSMFLHGSLTHLFFNMYALLIFGPLLERQIGSKRLLISYLVSGLFAGIIYSLYYTFIVGAPNTSALGASGAIMGFLGLVIMLLPKLKVLFFFIIPMDMRTAGIIFALIDLFGFIVPGDGIAHLAHLAGLAAGLMIGYFLVLQRKKYAKRFTGQSNNNYFKGGFGPRIKVKVHRTQFGQRRPSGNTNETRTRTKKASSGNYEETIELTKDDLDNYFKYGRI
jgi:membrane associated rhomboid family serine protease